MKKIFNKGLALKIIEQDDGAIIFNKKTGEYFQTNELGKLIIEMYISKLSLEQIANNISTEYDIPHSQAKLDIKNFLNDFLDVR